MEIDFFEDDKPWLTPEQLRKYPGLEHLKEEEGINFTDGRARIT